MTNLKQLITGTLFLLLTLPACTIQAADGTDIRISPEQKRQTIEGWGVSLCWWANMCGKWDEAKIDHLVNLLTAEDQLNWNIFRYNIGGGDDPSHIDGYNGHMCHGKGKRAEMEGFKASADADYNWDADAAQRLIMLKIKEKRPDAIFEAFSNSAPYWMTYSGCSAGNHDANKDNLRPEYYDAFCDYLIEVCKHYKEVYGIEFKTLEPFNEPVTNYWNYMGSQEGCHFDAQSQINLLRKLYPKLKASGLNTVISASDETGISTSKNVLQAYKNAGDIIPMLGQWNTHSYSGSNIDRANLQQLVSETGLPFWMSESGNGGDGLNGNLNMAQRLFNDLTYMQPTAWIDWQFVEEWNDQWCMVRGNFTEQTYTIIKNFYVRMQVTRFIKQGYTLIGTNNDGVLAALNPAGDELVVVALNTGSARKLLNFDLSAFGIVGDAADIYLTNQSNNCKAMGKAAVKAPYFSYYLDASSIATIIFSVGKPNTENIAITEECPFWLAPRAGDCILQATDNGVLLATPERDNINQQWFLRPSSTDGVYYCYIQTETGKQAITDAGSYYINLSDFKEGDKNQQFRLDSIDGGCITLRSMRTNKMLDLEGEKTVSGTRVGLWENSSGYANAHRQWRLIQIPYYTPSDISSIAEREEQLSTVDITTSRGSLTLQAAEACKVSIYSTTGNTLATFNLARNESKLTVLPAGIYIIRVGNSCQTNEVYKVLIP